MNGIDLIKARAFGAGGGGSGGSGGGSEMLNSLIDRSIAGELVSDASRVGGYSITDCIYLTSVKFPKAVMVLESAFQRSTALRYAEFASVEEIRQNSFRTTGVESLVLRSENLVTLSNSTALYDTPIQIKEGYIYVPSALVDTYKAATNWSTFAAQFRALEDYTVDGTTTGELDPEKIGA